MLGTPHQYIIYSYEHQQNVALLLRKIGNYFESKSMTGWEVLPAIKIEESATSPVPNLSICYDNDPKVIIELISNTTEDHYFQKMTELIDKYDLKEGFTYNYQSKRWRKFSKNGNKIEEGSSFCEAINYYLKDFLR